MSHCFSEGDWQAYLDREMLGDELTRAEAHLGQCDACAALQREVADRAERIDLLMVELSSSGEIVRRPSPRPHVWRWAVPSMALAAALLAVWLLPRPSPRSEVAHSAPTKPPRRRSAHRRADQPEESLLAGFVALDDEPIETAVIVRVTVDDGLAQADVIVGPDGRAHAIRMVPGNSGE
jgi:hypothetical protein